MKILVTGTRGIPNIMGGVETHCEELFPRLKERGFDIFLVRRKNYVNDNCSDYKGITLIDIDCPKKKAFEAIVHTWRAIWKAKKLNVDIIHIHAIGPALLTPVARLLGIKVIFTHHGPDYDRKKWGIFAKTILKLGERMGSVYANEVIVISHVINEIIRKKYKRTDAHLIYNGVPRPSFIRKTEYLNQLGIQSKKYIFTMGRFVPEKNFHDLIEAFSQSNLSDFKLVIAGGADFEDDYSKKLKVLASEKNVILTGFIKGEKLQALLTHAYTFVLPSSHEGLPIALLEAMSYNIPVLVSNIPANLAVNLTSDHYFQVGDQKELSEKLTYMVRKNIKEEIYDLQAYDWDVIAEQVSLLYKNMI